MQAVKKRRRLVFLKLSVVVCAAIVALVSFAARFAEPATASASGPVPSHTNAPNENNCTACHTTYAVNSGAGGIAISGVPNNYKPNRQIPVTVTVSQSDAIIYGFELTAIDSLGRKVGTYTLPAQTTPQLQLKTGFVGGNQREYVEHTRDGVIPTVFGSKSWTFMWNAPAQTAGKVSFYAAGNAANSDGRTSGDYIYTTNAAALSGTAIANFDGDLKSDIAVFRPETGVWFSLKSGNGAFQAFQFGQSGDRPVAGDYDGDGKSDYAVWRASERVWFIQQSTNGFRANQFGVGEDRPVVGDYDGDGKSDLAVYRPSVGTWYIERSTEGYTGYQFGLPTDKTAQGDFDGDGKTDVAVYRPSTGEWFLNRTRDGFAALQFGTSEDLPVPADYDGDGITDIAVYRPSTGEWFRLNSGSNFSFSFFQFGVATDIPAPADYDGDGKSDIAVYRPSSGVWFITRSSDNTYFGIQFGVPSDIPVPSSGFIAQ